MSIHSYSRCWIHLIWATYERERTLLHELAERVSNFLNNYSRSKDICMRVNLVNPDHVHAMIDLPPSLAIENVAKLLKGSSSHWINENRLIHGKFYWGRGYAAFSVSHSLVHEVSEYIAHQQEHHKKKTFQEEFEQFMSRYELEWKEETVKTVAPESEDPEIDPLDESRG